ncbi:MoaD/ThiS family protein [Desulforamulus putei]|uniref:MoaD/ThiS family protein n=1 Tax=Desulforamulus putei TaxID=74701 RepID=UPI000A05A772|nr:MoaD/ThiS family protein [Desulforamulus putei]
MKGTVKVELRGPLTRYAPDHHQGGPIWFNLSEHATVGSILCSLGIAREYISMMVVNGKKAEPSTPLGEGDHVILFPPVAGG